MKKYIIFIALWASSLSLLNAQNTMVVQGGHLIMNGSEHLVLQDATLQNNGTFTANDGTVVCSGTSAQTAFNSAMAFSFYNLEINKTNNSATISQDILVNNELKLTNGKLALGTHNLEIADNATISNANDDRYIQTNGTGVLIRKVDNSFVHFPVGNSTFNPAKLKNDGTQDDFSIRVIDQVYYDGTSGSVVTANVVPRTWLIEEAVNGGSDVTMQLVWRPNQAATGFIESSSQISHYTNGMWQDQTAGAATMDNSYGSDHHYREANSITSFSPFAVKSGAPLPVELLYFHAMKQNDAVQLDWETATEINNSHFEVEWSIDGFEFKQIGEVEGAGNTLDIQSYNFLHNTPLTGINYYRLKQVDFDGAFEYSDIVQVEFKKDYQLDIIVFPNPVQHNLQVQLSEDLLQNTTGVALIYNNLGQLVQQVPLNAERININVQDLVNGHYILKIQNENGLVITKQFVKQ